MYLSESNKTYKSTIVPIIEAVYNNLTSLEKTIADFFIHNSQKIDFSAKNISEKLFVSEASLSRFAKKCGYKGYREFVFQYKDSFIGTEKKVGDLTESVLNSYHELLYKSFNLVDEEQMNRISKLLTQKKRVFVYGKGSSGLAAKEMKLRFMRLGLDVEAVTDTHVMKMNSVRINNNCLVIGVSVSGKTSEVVSSIKAAKLNGASTIMITASKIDELMDICDEILLIGVLKNLDMGNVISPQFPVLVMIDIFYSYFLNTDYCQKSETFVRTLSALYDDTESNRNEKV